jgi:hypothetical protein
VNINFSQNRENYYFPKRTFYNSTIPPGTVELNDSLRIDFVPVTNIMYLEYLHSLKYFWTLRVHDSIKKLPSYGVSKIYAKKMFDGLPNDNVLWSLQLIASDLKINNGISSKHFIEHPNYSWFPVVNITKDQAELFCKWRTDMVKILLSVNTKNFAERKKFPLKIQYRLPTKQELEEAKIKYGISSKLKAKKGLPIVPYASKYNKHFEKAVFTEGILSEIILDDLPFGTNWRDERSFNLPNDYTGFRCVCEIK